jgi:ribosomal protein L10
MSKYVKNLLAEHLRQRLASIDDALLVNVVGLDANANNRLRNELRDKDINLIVVKNSLAARATAGTPLSAMFDGLTGTAAVCWGGEDIVSLTKEVTRLSKEDDYQAFGARGGVLEGELLTSEQVADISKWPSRLEQLGLLAGQILSPGATLLGQLTGPASTLAGQIGQLAEKENGQEPCEQ